jgi:hypothetical protein
MSRDDYEYILKLVLENVDVVAGKSIGRAFRKSAKIFHEAKKNIEREAMTQTEKLVKQNSDLEGWSLVVTVYALYDNYKMYSFDDLDKPTRGRPHKPHTALVGFLSTILARYCPKKTDMSKVISRILVTFYGLSSNKEADPENIRKHL